MRERQGNELDVLRPDRRQMLSLGLGAFVVASIPLALRHRPEGELVRRKIPVMGTIADLTVVGAGRRQAHAALDAAVAELRFVDRMMTAFSRTSDVGRANDRAAQQGVIVGDATAAVVTEGLRWAQGTDGRFDPCLGRATALWDVKQRTTPPAAAQVEGLARRALWRRLDVDVLAGSPCIRYGCEEVRLDLGGIAKGHAVDRAADALRRAGIRHALVNVGGDLVALGRSPDGDAWQVGIRSPEDPQAILATLEIENGAIATSGDYEQAFEHAGRRYHHLLDSATASPRAGTRRSLTVGAPTCMAADAAATAAFGLASNEAQAVLDSADGTARVLHVA